MNNLVKVKIKTQDFQKPAKRRKYTLLVNLIGDVRRSDGKAAASSSVVEVTARLEVVLADPVSTSALSMTTDLNDSDMPGSLLGGGTK